MDHKAIYSKDGVKIAIHKNVTNELPGKIIAVIKKSDFKTWKISMGKEEIFKDTEKDNLKVYKVEVMKGPHKHHLFYSNEGELLKDKNIR